MSYFKNINSLPFLLGLMLIVLWFLIPDKRLIFDGHPDFLRNEFTAESAFFTSQSQSVLTIKSASSNFEIYYSLNGGSDYQVVSGQQIDMLNLSNSEIEYLNTSIRWRHPINTDFKIKNLVLKSKNKETGEISNAKSFNYVENYPSELPAVCLTLPESDLFSWSEGMMVFGSASQNDPGFYKEWWYRKANFSERGKQWKKRANLQYFENGELVLNQDCGLKISGNATRYFAQKSLKLYAGSSYGKKNFKRKFWGEEGISKSKTLLLRNSGNDNGRTFFADLILHRLSENSNVLSQKGRPVNVFLNGRYWGIYNLRERIDQNFIAQKDSCEKDDVTILYCEVYADRTILRDGSEKEKAKFDDLYSSLNLNEALSPEGYQILQSEIDITSFSDYIFFETYYANNDWLHNNTAWYKVKGGKWKWLLNDLDVTLTYPGSDHIKMNFFDKLKKTKSVTSDLFNALISNEDFKRYFKKRVHELLNSNLSVDNIEKTFDETQKEYEKDIQNQISRWRGIENIEIWKQSILDNKEFLIQRKSIYLKHLEAI